MSIFARLSGIIAILSALGMPEAFPADSATITIASGKKQMDFAGFVDVGSEQTPPDVKMFDQADLGNPDLDEEKWRALEYRVLDLFSSGQPLTISAEGKGYLLPPVKQPGWRAQWEKIC